MGFIFNSAGEQLGEKLIDATIEDMKFVNEYSGLIDPLADEIPRRTELVGDRFAQDSDSILEMWNEMRESGASIDEIDLLGYASYDSEVMQALYERTILRNAYRQIIYRRDGRPLGFDARMIARMVVDKPGVQCIKKNYSNKLDKTTELSPGTELQGAFMRYHTSPNTGGELQIIRSRPFLSSAVLEISGLVDVKTLQPAVQLQITRRM